MFCPKCKYEYNFGVLVCPDCDEKLVEILPEDEKEPFTDDTKIVEVFQTSDRSILSFAKSILEENDIISIISPPIGIRGSAAVYQFFVNENEADKARELLDGIEDSQAEAIE